MKIKLTCLNTNGNNKGRKARRRIQGKEKMRDYVKLIFPLFFKIKPTIPLLF